MPYIHSCSRERLDTASEAPPAPQRLIEGGGALRTLSLIHWSQCSRPSKSRPPCAAHMGFSVVLSPSATCLMAAARPQSHPPPALRQSPDARRRCAWSVRLPWCCVRAHDVHMPRHSGSWSCTVLSQACGSAGAAAVRQGAGVRTLQPVEVGWLHGGTTRAGDDPPLERLVAARQVLVLGDVGDVLGVHRHSGRGLGGILLRLMVPEPSCSAEGDTKGENQSPVEARCSHRRRSQATGETAPRGFARPPKSGCAPATHGRN
jgi:hypothetical protein